MGEREGGGRQEGPRNIDFWTFFLISGAHFDAQRTHANSSWAQRSYQKSVPPLALEAHLPASPPLQAFQNVPFRLDNRLEFDSEEPVQQVGQST